MRFTYDPEANAAYIYLTDAAPRPGGFNTSCDPPEGEHAWVVIDWTSEGQMYGIEVLDARRRLPADLLKNAELPGQSN